MNWYFMQEDASRLANAAEDLCRTAYRLGHAIRSHRRRPTESTANAVDLAASHLGDALAALDRARTTYTETETNVLGASALLPCKPEGGAQ
jgi:hypothetical protein